MHQIMQIIQADGIFVSRFFVKELEEKFCRHFADLLNKSGHIFWRKRKWKENLADKHGSHHTMIHVSMFFSLLLCAPQWPKKSCQDKVPERKETQNYSTLLDATRRYCRNISWWTVQPPSAALEHSKALCATLDLYNYNFHVFQKCLQHPCENDQIILREVLRILSWQELFVVYRRIVNHYDPSGVHHHHYDYRTIAQWGKW
jgi:hypothetical protein